MKEILFKAKRVDNGEWAFGDFIHDFRDKGDCIRQGAKYGECGYFIVCKETLCQYTGKKDIKGEKIFDGDIVRLRTGRICKVIYKPYAELPCFDLEPVSGIEFPAPKSSFYMDSEVIGNIHNKEE